MNKAIQTLEFNKIKERLSEFCQSSLGKQLVDNLYPTVNIKAVETSILSMKSYKDIEEEISYSVSGALVLSQASKNLGRIRRLKENQKEKIEKTLQVFLSSNSNKSLIQEFFISEKMVITPYL